MSQRAATFVFFWESGAYISSEHADFTADFNALVDQYGAPDRFEVREDTEARICALLEAAASAIGNYPDDEQGIVETLHASLAGLGISPEEAEAVLDGHDLEGAADFRGAKRVRHHIIGPIC